MPRYEPPGAMGTYKVVGKPLPPHGPERTATLALEDRFFEVLHRCSSEQPYQPDCAHSFFGDLLELERHNERAKRALENVILRGKDDGEIPSPSRRGDTIEKVKQRLSTVRDLSSGSVPDALRPSAPGWIADMYGRASRQSGQLAAAINRRPLEAGMVDVSSGVPVLRSIPRLVSGAAVAPQTSENAAVQETDPTTDLVSTPIGTIAGQVDKSRQLFDLSHPNIDEVVAEDLGARHGAALDAQLINGAGASGQLRGLLNWSGILSVSGSVSSVQAALSKIWSTYSTLASSTGFGNPNPDDYLTIMHPRRFAWLYSGAGASSVPVRPLLPGTVVVTAGIPTTLGAGSEDVILMVEKSNLYLASAPPILRVYEQVGSGNLTVRLSSWANAALLLLNPAAVAKITGFTAPSF